MRSRRSDDGAVGSVEILAFGTLVFVVGTLIVANAWGAIDARTAAETAAREAVRAYVEQDDEAAALAAASDAATAAFQGHGRDPDRMSLTVHTDTFRRCARVVAEVTYEVPIVDLPFLQAVGDAYVVAARHSEIVDPYRSDLDGRADCA